MPLFHERLSVLVQRVGSSLRNINKKLFASLPVVLLMVSVSPVNSDLLVTPAPKKADQISLAFSTTNPRIVSSTDSISVIVPGESAHQREIRLKAEAAAEAAKIAEAERAAKAAKATIVKAKAAKVVSTVPDPSNFDDLYRAAGASFGVDPMLLKAIHIVETGASGSTARSNASGATGPMQFLPSTFRNHAVDGNGDGVKDIHNVSDAVYSAAEYLRACGYPNLKKALWGYNPSTSYYNKVVGIARSMGMQ